MLSHGDEIGRTQRGNNNAYCQDNELAWVDWSMVRPESDLLDFVRALSKLRREHPVFQRRRFFHGRHPDNGKRDLVWLTPGGREMTAGDWHISYAKSLMVYLNGEAITEPGPRGERIVDDSFLLLINAHHENMPFTLPGEEFGTAWLPVLDTNHDTVEDAFLDERWLPNAVVAVTARSLQVLRQPRQPNP